MEKEFIAWLIQNHQAQSRSTPIGLGDDAAVVRMESGEIVITTDTIADGTHFDTSRHDLVSIGHKAIAVSLSDIAAMGACPSKATVHFTCPADYDLSHMKKLFRGIAQTANQYQVSIVGGDTNRWDGRLVLGTTVIGCRYENSVGGFWTMAGGQPGDQIFVSGKLGGSIISKHLEFTPPAELTFSIATRYQVNAATDITDSLALDLATIAKRSGCGFCIHAESVPVAQDAARLAETSGQSALEHALYDGEDFELILCVSKSVAHQFAGDVRLQSQLTWIGELMENQDYLIKSDRNAPPRPLAIRGFAH